MTRSIMSVEIRKAMLETKLLECNTCTTPDKQLLTHTVHSRKPTYFTKEWLGTYFTAYWSRVTHRVPRWKLCKFGLHHQPETGILGTPTSVPKTNQSKSPTLTDSHMCKVKYITAIKPQNTMF